MDMLEERGAGNSRSAGGPWKSGCCEDAAVGRGWGHGPLRVTELLELWFLGKDRR